MNPPVSAIVVDAREKVCPLPILELAKALRPLGEGDEVVLWATDPAVEPDVAAFCAARGHRLVSFSAQGRVLCARIVKGGRSRELESGVEDRGLHPSRRPSSS